MDQDIPASLYPIDSEVADPPGQVTKFHRRGASVVVVVPGATVVVVVLVLVVVVVDVVVMLVIGQLTVSKYGAI
jgi:hypothetical protein